MDQQSVNVGYHQEQLRQLAGELRWARRPRAANAASGRLAVLRHAVGRRLVAVGSALMEDAGGRLAPTR